MAVSLSQQMMSLLPELRYQPSLKHVVARLGSEPVADTDHAVLVWEPRRVVPSYAVPESDVSATLMPVEPDEPMSAPAVQFGGDGPPLLDPRVPFTVHTADGEPLTVRADGLERKSAAFRLSDADLRSYLLLDFAAFDWWEEDEPIISHPHDPFHRIDIRRSSRHIRLEHRGTLLADTERAKLLFEGTFPMTRYYLPREDVTAELVPGNASTACAYKGRAHHWSAVADGQTLADIAWSYEDPLPDAAEVKGMVSFYQEQLDLFVDGALLERVRTPWS